MDPILKSAFRKSMILELYTCTIVLIKKKKELSTTSQESFILSKKKSVFALKLSFALNIHSIRFQLSVTQFSFMYCKNFHNFSYNFSQHSKCLEKIFFIHHRLTLWYHGCIWLANFGFSRLWSFVVIINGASWPGSYSPLM